MSCNSKIVFLFYAKITEYNGTSCVEITVEEGPNLEDWYWGIYETASVTTIIGGDGYFGYYEEGCDGGCLWEEETYEAGYQLFIDECNYYYCLSFDGLEYAW